MSVFPALRVETAGVSPRFWRPAESLLAVHTKVCFWAVYSILLLNMSEVPHSFDYCSFVVSFIITKCETCNFALLFQNCLKLFIPFTLHLNHRISFFFLYLQQLWYIYLNCVTSVEKFRENWHFNCTKSSIHENIMMSLHLFMPSS